MSDSALDKTRVRRYIVPEFGELTMQEGRCAHRALLDKLRALKVKRGSRRPQRAARQKRAAYASVTALA